MTVKKRVFASNAERENYYKLMRVWGDEYHLHHNLPFLNVFHGPVILDLSESPPKSVEISGEDYNRLKKTSIDYTLCTRDDEPLVCVDFDGMQEGFNVGTAYKPGVPESPWR